MKLTKGYLAGNMITNWRDGIKDAAPHIEWIEPARGNRWFELQCKQMDEADFCFAVIDMKARHIGTIAEMSAFRVMNKPRLLLIDYERTQDRAYDMAMNLATYVTTELDFAIDYLFRSDYL